MFYKKWTFSLKILVMLLAIGLVAIPPAIAGEFGVSMSVASGVDISAEGGIQVMSETPVTVRIRFGKVVDIGTGTGFDASDITVIAYNEFGGVETAPTLGAPSPYPGGPDGKNFMFMVPAPGAAVTRVLLHMPKHKVELADPRAELDAGKRKAEGKSAEANLTIHYVSADVGGPTVYSIRRPSDPLLPLTASDTSVRVVVTLSEKPKEFKKDHISVSNADVDGDPVALDPVPEITAEVVLAQAQLTTTLRGGTPPTLRGLYNGQDRYGANADVPAGIHDAINGNTAYTDPGDDGEGTDAFDNLPVPIPQADATDSAPIAVPSTMLAADLEVTAVTPNVTLPEGTDRTVDPGVAPKVEAYANADDFNAAFNFHTARKQMYDAYQNEVKRHQAYNDAVAAEMKIDDDALAMYLEVTLTDEDAPVIQTGTGRDMMLHPFVVTIKPKFANKNSIVVKVKTFEDQSDPPQKYIPPTTEVTYMEGRDKLTIKVGYEKPKAVLTAGLIINIPKEKRIPNGGYIVFTKNAGNSGIKKPAGSDKDEPKNTERTPAQLLYNVVDLGLPNLETFLLNGGTIDLVAPENVVISEIMWGSDASVDNSFESQWIEIRNNSGKSLLTGDKNYKLVFYAPNETLPAVSTVKDRVGTAGAHGYWSIAGKGQSGRTGLGEAPGDVTAVTPTQDLISMQRVIDATAGTAADGTAPSSWAASSPPGLNFDSAKEGTRIGSPGSAPVAYPTAPTPEPTLTPPTPEPTVPVATATELAISEVMVDTGDGRLPQWIEITNTSSAEVSLAGWTLEIMNTDDDADAVGTSISADLSGTLGVGEGVGNGDGEGQSLLLVAWTTRINSRNFNEDRVMSLATALGQTGRYKLLSEMGFRVAIAPPQTTGVKVYGDMVGNLGEAWEVPMVEGSRSSLIRVEMDTAGMALMGTSADGWRLASTTDLLLGPNSYYGSDEDAGTPGYDSGGPLPVELSMFYPARDRLTGQVVITWDTQSELNNAGFFIKRSEARNGKFVVINPTMIAGAGTTAEKQSYTYTDTTAKPNVLYYYQIEDVSLDGQRQTLTLGHRLRGHIGAAGKVTTTWGELKAKE